MFKKLSVLFIVLFMLAISLPAMAVGVWDGYYNSWGNTYAYQDQAGINTMLTGIEIEPVNVSQSEQENCGECSWNDSFGFNWGGLSVDLIAIQAIRQTQEIGVYGYGYANAHQQFYNNISLETPTMSLHMNQAGYQNANASSNSWYWGPSYGYPAAY